MDLGDLVHKTWNFALTIPALILVLPLYALVRKTELLVDMSRERDKGINGSSHYPSSSPTQPSQEYRQK